MFIGPDEDQTDVVVDPAFLRVSVESLEEAGPVAQLLLGMHCVLHYRDADGEYIQYDPKAGMSLEELRAAITSLQDELFRRVTDRVHKK